ncbi:hypothetical protein M5689_006678 [Euphorbia peplus]|nr:hypothetical protein M5689_006678 [Euphorbia peplus]
MGTDPILLLDTCRLKSFGKGTVWGSHMNTLLPKKWINDTFFDIWWQYITENVQSQEGTVMSYIDVYWYTSAFAPDSSIKWSHFNFRSCLEEDLQIENGQTTKHKAVVMRLDPIDSHHPTGDILKRIRGYLTRWLPSD